MSNTTILLVDDESSVLNALRRELRDWSKKRSIEILTSQSATEGLSLFSSHSDKIALIVSDMRMSGMSGSDFLLEVKDKYPDIMTILMSGYSDVKEITKAIKAGVYSFILKPWDAEYLQSELDKALEFQRLQKERADFVRILSAELVLASELQRTILRPRIGYIEDVDFNVSYRPIQSLGCGGDYYDIIDLGGNDQYLCLLGDVAGHGIRGAIVTGILKAVIYPEYVSGKINKDLSPAQFLTWLNGRMEFELGNATGLIISFLAVLIDRKRMSLVYANAGQCHPYIVQNGVPLELPVSGPCIGITRNPEYTENSLTLHTGDLFFAYSDGLVDL